LSIVPMYALLIVYSLKLESQTEQWFNENFSSCTTHLSTNSSLKTCICCWK